MAQRGRRDFVLAGASAALGTVPFLMFGCRPPESESDGAKDLSSDLVAASKFHFSDQDLAQACALLKKTLPNLEPF